MKLKLISEHYEKVILAVALVFFIISLAWLINVFNNISTKVSEGIVVSASKTTYKPVDKKIYSSTAVLDRTKSWLKSKKRNLNPKSPEYIITFTDFMIPFKIARSKAPGAGNKLIPYAYYEVGICPISKEKIALKKAVVGKAEDLDTDKDGIPDVVEKLYNMDSKNPDDIYGDIDNDGFSNIDEFRFNPKGIVDKLVHPDLINRLELVKVSNVRLPFILKKIIKQGDDKKNWVFQINYKQPGHVWTTKFLRLGDSIEVNDMKYTIRDVQDKTTSILDPRLGTVVDKDISSVVFYNNLNEKINVQKDEWVYEPNRKITLKNLYTGKLITARINNVITLGDKTTGIEKYKIVAIGNNDNNIEFERNGKIFVVSKESSYKPPVKSAIMPNEDAQAQEEEDSYVKEK